MTTSPRVLIVDDEPHNRAILVRLLQREGYETATASDGEDALRQIDVCPPDLVLLDVVMPGLDGFAVCRSIRRSPFSRFIPVVLVTGLHDQADKIQGIDAGADDFLAKPFDPEELKARVQSLVRLKRSIDDLDSAESVITSLALTIESRDPYTQGHCERLADYAAALGADVGLPAEDLAALRLGGYLHDLGKIGISDTVLRKPAALTPIEYEAMKQHPIIGERLCGELRTLRRVRPIVRSHHERLDGSGYPDGLHGDDVPLLAQVVAIVDAYDAITTNRPYRSARPAGDA